MDSKGSISINTASLIKHNHNYTVFQKAKKEALLTLLKEISKDTK